MKPSTLSSEQIETFLRDGFVVLQNCFSQDVAADWKHRAFARLGYDLNDSTTWEKPRIHMPPEKWVDVADFAPEAFGGICDLIGGADRGLLPFVWADAHVVNLREGADRPYEAASAKVNGWHKDGYFFRHYLDSPEQGLLVIVSWTDMLSRGGATFIAPDSVGVVSRYLAEHPEGVEADAFVKLINDCHDFREVTARAGDVVLLHPYMLHSVSQNHLQVARLITNPLVSLRQPMNFNRADAAEFSPVERAVLKELGVARLDFRATGRQPTSYPGWLLQAQKELSAASPA